MSDKVLGVVWFRQDLRLSDNPALARACRECDAIIPLFIDDPLDHTLSQVGEASRAWLHHSLMSLQQQLRDKGSNLYFMQGGSLQALQSLIEISGASRVFWNRCYDPHSIERDTEIKASLARYSPKTANALLIHEPWSVLKDDGTPYRVYTPYWRRSAKQLADAPEALKTIPAPRKIPVLDAESATLSCCVSLSELALMPERDWGEQMMSHWKVGEKAAASRLRQFLTSSVQQYKEGRNLPGVSGTSRMSPHLHFGEISPRQILKQVLGDRSLSSLSPDEETFVKEVFWREFAYSLLYHFPQTLTEPLDARFKAMKWAKNSQAHLRAWQQGMTGVPIVDAGMRELYATGWMHNRVRMIVASYLIKNLLIPWQQGEQWFRNTLVDADIASNVMGWQWTAGCGADAAPFYRIFNPVLQGEKFDKEGHYVKQWVPELAKMPAKYLHKPWELPTAERARFDYPDPLVDLKQTRARALAAFEGIKGTNQAD